MLRFAVLALSLLVLAPPDARAQGFSFFNGRNHPELDWQVAETEHFEIAYPQRLAGIEAHAAAIAEASYDSLSKALGGVTFDRKLRVYLSDEDEIANGVAFNVGRAGFTTIWVHVNEIAEIWTGEEKWLRKVLAHELAHLFHYRAIQTNLGLLQNLVATPIPSFWAEGLAQYLTEDWDAQRGDRWLRTAVFEDRLSYNDGTSAWNGRLKYAVGNSQVRVLAERYGDSTLVKLLEHRRPVAFGLFEVHDFYDAFEATTGQTYRNFYDEWRTHVNVYYNTMAGQMERLDSLGAEPLPLPGQYLYHVAFSPDTSRLAGLTLSSLARPVRRLYVMTNPGDSLALAERGRDVRVLAEGAVLAPFAWHPDGTHLAYARRHRGAHGSLLNDLYVVDVETGRTRQLTHDRRAQSPTYAPDGTRLAFIGVDAAGTANAFVLDLTAEPGGTGVETPMTDFTGDVQLTGLRWSPDGTRLAAARFDADGTRDLIVIDARTGVVESLAAIAAQGVDNRGPVWSPDGERLAFVSLRDDIPNVFVADLGPPQTPPDLASAKPAPYRRLSTPTLRPSTSRVTFLFNGAEVDDWLPADSAHAAGRLVLRSTDTKQSDRVYVVPADRTPTVRPGGAPGAVAAMPPAYRAWTLHRPTAEVPEVVPPDASLVQKRYAYNSLANLTHAVSLVLPYYDSPEDYGFFGTTTWLEPLGKHQLGAIAGVSIPDFVDRSFALLTYVNNTLWPSLVFRGYRFPGPSRFYGEDLLLENLTGGDASAVWPLDWLDRPYTSLAGAVRLRLAYAEPFDADAFADLADVDVAGGTLPPPQQGTRADVRLGLAYKFQRPYRYNVIHPLDGTGLRARLTVGVPEVNTGGAFAQPDLTAYTVVPDPLAFGRFYAYGRAQARFGGGFAQDVLGLARFDDVDLQLPIYGPLTSDELERVRGFRRPALGDRVLFGTLEYRLPPVFDLNTTILGLVGFGRTGLALFADGAVVWTGSDLNGAIRRTGVGAEVKNVLSLGGFRLLHSLGVAAPWGEIGDDLVWDDVDLYYRIQAAVAF